MLLRYFDQKVQKSRFAECGNSMVPFGTTKLIGTKIGTRTIYPIRIILNCTREVVKDNLVPGKIF